MTTKKKVRLASSSRKNISKERWSSRTASTACSKSNRFRRSLSSTAPEKSRIAPRASRLTISPTLFRRQSPKHRAAPLSKQFRQPRFLITDVACTLISSYRVQGAWFGGAGVSPAVLGRDGDVKIASETPAPPNPALRSKLRGHLSACSNRGKISGLRHRYL